METQADRIFEKLPQQFPELPQAWVEYGYRQLSKGEHEQAAEAFEKALELGAAEESVAVGMTLILWKKGNKAKARAWAEQISAEDPRRELVRGILTELGLGSGKGAKGTESEGDSRDSRGEK